MPRKWTREERRKHIREKYYTWREKSFVTFGFLVILFIVLYLAFTSAITVQTISLLAIFDIALLFFLIAYGGLKEAKIPILILAAILAILIIIGIVLVMGTLGGLEKFIAAIIFGVLFLVLIAFAAFFIDMYTYESG